MVLAWNFKTIFGTAGEAASLFFWTYAWWQSVGCFLHQPADGDDGDQEELH
jgi:hypothetical protein